MSDEKNLMAPATEPVALAPISVESLEKSIAQAERYMKALDRIRKLSIGMTNASDWTNQSGKPYLLASGCNKIAGGFGITVYDTRESKEQVDDDKGPYILYTFSGCAVWQNNTTQQIGTCSTRDDFFSMRSGERLPLSEVDLTDVKKKAFTNFLNRIIKALLGLSFTWEEIAEYSNGRIGPEGTAKVAYQSGSKGGTVNTSADDQPARVELGNILMEMSSGNKEAAADFCAALTTFTGKDGKVIAGIKDLKKLSGKRLEIALQKAKEQYAEWKKNMEGGAA